MTSCDEVQTFLSAYEHQVDFADRSSLEQHVGSCPNCQSELEKFEEIRNALGALKEEAIDPPMWLMESIVQRVTERAAHIAAMNRVKQEISSPKVVSGSALLVAGLAGALILRGRRRKRRGFTSKLKHALAPA